MDVPMELLVKKLESVEAALREYREENTRWWQEQNRRNSLRNASIATIRETLSDIDDRITTRQRKTLSVREAARHAKVKNDTIRRWLNDGRLKGAKAGDNQQSRWRVDRADLDSFLARNTTIPD